jgi:hypothetical protein
MEPGQGRLAKKVGELFLVQEGFAIFGARYYKYSFNPSSGNNLRPMLDGLVYDFAEFVLRNLELPHACHRSPPV